MNKDNSVVTNGTGHSLIEDSFKKGYFLALSHVRDLLENAEENGCHEFTLDEMADQLDMLKTEFGRAERKDAV